MGRSFYLLHVWRGVGWVEVGCGMLKKINNKSLIKKREKINSNFDLFPYSLLVLTLSIQLLPMIRNCVSSYPGK